ncbi:MAG: transposase [Oscillospiraceae bacterium]|jgi:hypothetical protein|nr:transposase [Oscillospiraceae bacterium]
MMGRTDKQLQMIVMDLGELIPDNHLLKKMDACVSFSFIYDLLAPYYPATGRPSIDPVSMFKMLLIGYLYGIKSERCRFQSHTHVCTEVSPHSHGEIPTPSQGITTPSQGITTFGTE